MNFLLPHRFKKVGALIAPAGFALWLLMQWGYITRLLSYFFGERPIDYTSSWYHTVNVVAATTGFLCFLGGIYFITFSKEKIEDEMVQKTRRDSFQFAALVQIAVIIVGFLLMVLIKEPGEGSLMLFFISVLFLFWLSFISRFNYILHIKLRQ